LYIGLLGFKDRLHFRVYISFIKILNIRCGWL
jgi:hypothetical protein